MSADSPNHSRPELSPAMQNIVTPQPVTDPTILDSVAGFINEVVPTTGGDPFDSKDQIQWARFENLDFDESSFSPATDAALPSSLILVLGYTTGVQVWAVPANGEAVELFSWRHGFVKVLRILPAPYEVGGSNKRDHFESKRPLIALVDVATHHGSSAASLNFYSLKTGEQTKQIKFKSHILDVVANRRSVVITFSERIAVFDAFTLEDKLSVTSCYLSPGIQPNPVALGPRWLAFAEKKLVTSRRSSGGNEGEGVQSYTATVLYAAKSLGRGLKELGDAVASSLTGNPGSKLGTSPNSPQAGGSGDVPQKGIVTVLDIESTMTQNADGSLHPESVVAHFVAHTEAVVWLQFGPCGLLLLTADKRGHDFNLFRINPHPVGSALAAVHHLYTLHRGDTSARVQDMCFSFDSRWVTVSTLRGTTHVFPITPYGGNIGVRTHTTPHVVNKMSRFHRSAGLTSEGRSNSPVSSFDSPVGSNFPYHNPRFSPFPHPTVVNPLSQLRQPVYMQNIGNAAPRQGRQRLTSSSEDNIALRVTTCFAPARAWIDSTSTTMAPPRETGLNKAANKPVESLFVMNCHGNLMQYDLEPHHLGSIPKERVCDDTPVELTVTAKAQWRLQRQPASMDRPLPLPHQSLLYVVSTIPAIKKKIENGNDDDWLSQVEIITHAGPHRRLWMGPQFTFKTYTTANGTPMSLADAQPLDLNRSKPVNMPITKANAVLIESSSASSSEQSLLDIYRKNCEEMGAAGEHQIKEDLADAMIESPGVREAGGRCVLVSVKTSPIPAPPIAKVVNPLGTVVTVPSSYDPPTEAALVPEEIVIYENCDETLFRPLVSPNTLAYCKASKADGGNIMTQSLRGDTNVTVRVMDKGEGVCAATNWEDPRVQDIKNNTKVIVQEGEVSDLLVQRAIEEACDGRDEERKKFRSKHRPNNKDNTPQPISSSVKSTKTKPFKISCDSTINDSEIGRKTTSPPAQQASGDEGTCKKAFSKSKLLGDDFNPSELEESSSAFGLVNPLYNVLEECERIKSNKTFTGEEECVSSRSKDTCAMTFNKSTSFTINNNKPSSRSRRKPIKHEQPATLTKDDDSSSILKGLRELTTFPALDSKLVNPEFPPLEENFFSLENLAKAEKYEDAVDCGLPLLEPIESFFGDEEPPPMMESSSVSTSEDNAVLEDDKSTTNKKASLRKPIMRKQPKAKPKLGVKIGSSFSNKEDNSPERGLNKDSSPEITLPAPKRSWSSIAASKPPPPLLDPWSNNNNNNNNDDLKQSSVEMSYTITLPSKKSTVTTEKLLDIDTPDETQGLDKIAVEEPSLVCSPDLLKLSDKSSDDEKIESGSSPVETTTTESSDEGKVRGVVTDEFEVNKAGTIAGAVASGEQLNASTEFIYNHMEDLSIGSSFSSASRASPTPSFGEGQLLHFPGDSSGSI